MQLFKRFATIILSFCPTLLFSQTTYLTKDSKEYQLLERLEIKQGHNLKYVYPTVKPFSRRDAVREVQPLSDINTDSTITVQTDPKLRLTAVDKYNIQSLLMDNSEWVTGSKESFKSKKSVFNTFYKTKANMIEVDNKDFFLAVNPMLSYQQSPESIGGKRMFFNSRGINVRGLIAGRVGFYTSVTDNQERGPDFFLDRVETFKAVPGVGFYKPFKTAAYDYFDARGYITFNAAKFIDFQFGYDKNFIGDGYRSLFLGDEGNSYLFLKINTKLWKFNYQNIFMELMPQFTKDGNDELISRKYAAMHHLSINATKWLNVGLFEGIIFGRKDHFDFQYLNPVIFLRHVEGTVGSPDNALAGLDFKANVAHKLQFYGQFLLDEFKLSEVRKQTGWWGNKYGFQAGVKYVDAFTIPNLDIQLEVNRVRPFTYSHGDSVAEYSHYKQPLAHPLGANFQEVVGIANYQPCPKWRAYARMIYYYQGLDSAGYNFGSNILTPYTLNRPHDYGFNIGSGYKATCFNSYMQVSYEFKENLFIEGSVLYRTYKIAQLGLSTSTTQASVGIRWNMFRRDYNY